MLVGRATEDSAYTSARSDSDFDDPESSESYASSEFESAASDDAPHRTDLRAVALKVVLLLGRRTSLAFVRLEAQQKALVAALYAFFCALSLLSASFQVRRALTHCTRFVVGRAQPCVVALFRLHLGVWWKCSTGNQ